MNFRVGELESTVAHRDSVIDQLNHRVLELENRYFLIEFFQINKRKIRAGQAEHINHDRPDLQQQINDLQWRLGETTHSWNDAKWRFAKKHFYQVKNF